VVPTRGVGQLHLGRKDWEATPQQGVIFTSGPPRALDYREDCEALAIVLDRRKIAESCAKLMGRDIREGVDFDPLFSLDGAGGHNWLQLANYGAAELSNLQSFVRSLPAARQQLEQMMITGLLLAHTHNYSHALLQPQAAAAPYYVKRAEAYIEAHFAEPLSLAEIAAQAGVSARSLQNGFQNFRNMTPMAFLRSVRLQRVHRVLLAADPTSAKVTDIALDCGFNHMGEFATAYRRAFGETPRQTLARTRFG
jgi:AraC-like DNA-binding protein